MIKFVWIPESPTSAGLYANKDGTDLKPIAKTQSPNLQPSTMDPNRALQFNTKEECMTWCNANPYPIFVPIEHGFSRPVGSITVLCGISGSGKSTWAEENKDKYVRVCPDEIRLEMLGIPYSKESEDWVWLVAKLFSKVLLKDSKDILIDATALSSWSRKMWTQMAEDFGVPCYCVVINTPHTVSKERNNKRDRVVPENVMNRQIKSFTMPTKEEGFETITVINET